MKYIKVFQITKINKLWNYEFSIQNWEDIVSQSLSYLVGNEITLNIQNDNPVHLIMRLRTLIDFAIQLITTVKDELPDKCKRENSRGILIIKQYNQYYNFT